ncbi:MAG TPA: glycosyltransferase family 2 protein [Bacteroidota bacterium]|jgi:dolichol-phosphate mannosyltransferase
MIPRDIVLSVVVPVYNEEENLPEFFYRTIPILSSITENYEVIVVMDPSIDRTEEVTLEHRITDDRIKLIKLSRRFGQPMAILAGLQYSSGAAVVVMDVDLQDPPELIIRMVAKWREGSDVVYAQRSKREGETVVKKLIATVGYKLINRISDVYIPPNTGEFRLMSRRVVDRINSMKESHGFLRGMVAVVGFRQTVVVFDRPARFAGEGKYNRFVGSLRIGMNGLVGYSSYLLALSTTIGFLIAGFSFALGVVYLIMKLSGFPFPLGNPTVVVLVLFMGGIQLISVGILGEYIGRIYEEVKGRPKFIVDTAVGLADQERVNSDS